ncbi:MAG: hypothetical protein ACRC8M_01510 [Cetobacterium sp.]|uniref:Ig-like domain-containing protein n=1 Tax=Cetobacterium sp. TaxID=2071632 RepID=UPI003F40CA84
MKKFIIMLMLLSSVPLLAFKLSELEFGETLAPNTKKSKEFTIENNSRVLKKYEFSVDNQNIEIQPKEFKLKPNEKRKFLITVDAKKLKGTHDYFLIIKDSENQKSKNVVNLHKVVRIKQKYHIN